MKVLVRRKWRRPPDLSVSFYGFPSTLRYTQELITGDPDQDFYQWVIDNHLADKLPVESCLSICCGHGISERILAEKGVFRRCLGIDLEPVAIDEARRLAEEAGHSQISYSVQDIEQIQLQPASLDLVVSVGGLHHLSRLQHVIGQIHSALRPGGILMAHEYVGPDYWQLTPRQHELVNALIHLIPHDRRDRFEYNYWPAWLWPLQKIQTLVRRSSRRSPFALIEALRRSLGSSSRAFGKLYAAPPEWYWRLRDPTEGQRASEIIPRLEERFDNLDIHYFNGSILYHALDETFYRTHDPDDPRHERLMQLLISIERELISLGEISSINAFIVAKKQ